MAGLAGLIPPRQKFYGIFFDKRIVQLSGFHEAKSRSKETWFSRIIERFSRRVDQSVAFTKPPPFTSSGSRGMNL